MWGASEKDISVVVNKEVWGEIDDEADQDNESHGFN